MAARRHWRFVVRDQYGFVIQNAQVFVYQPGTTTVFTGTAYDAASGGSPVTNPFTTNAFGEVEAWFDTAQVVDVKVTDNSNLAYRAVGGASATVDFSDFTEKDDIYVSASDQVSQDFGEAGDIAAGIVNPFTAVTAVAGASGEYADAAHVHPYTALTPGTPEKPRSTASAGDDLEPARDDHIHGFAADANDAAVALIGTTTTETALATLSVPASVVAVGSAFRIKSIIYVTNTTAATRVLTFRLRWGGVAGVQLGGSVAITIRASLGTDVGAVLEGLVTIRSVGASGTAVADIVVYDKLTAATLITAHSAITAAATIDTTAAKDLVLTATWTTSDANTNLDIDNALIEQVA